MQKRYTVACGVAGGAAVLLAVLRMFGGGVYTAALCLAALLAAAVVLLCGAKQKPLLIVTETPAKVLGVVTALVGVMLLLFSASQAMALLKGIYPYPQPAVGTGPLLGNIIVWATDISGIGGGVVFILGGIQWFTSGATQRGRFGAAALLPVVWLWGRLVWYMTSFASAVNRFSSLTEAVLLLLEMLFLLSFARYLSGVEETAPRFTVPLSLCTAMVGAAVWLVRLFAILRESQTLYVETELIVFPDFGLLLLAAVFAYSQMFGNGTETWEEQPAPEEDSDEEDDTPRFVLSADDMAVTDEEESEEMSDEERKPMGLEDIIGEILKQKEEKK